MRSAQALSCAVVVGLAGGCGAEDTGPVRTTLAAGAAARVADQAIDVRTVAAIAAAERLTLAQARDRAIHDALLAAGARARLPAEAAAGEARVLARALLRRLWRDVRAQPITEQELADHTAAAFVDLDRPAGWRVIHAVVMAGREDKPEVRERARRHSESIRQAVTAVAEQARATPAPRREGKLEYAFGVPEAPVDPIETEFIEVVRGTNQGGLQVRSEGLPVLAADGRYIDYGAAGGEGVVLPFAAAVAALQTRGDLSPVVETDFGFHVILLLGRTAPQRVARAERLERLRERIFFVRARAAQRDLLRLLGEHHRVEVMRNADALMSEIDVAKRGEAGGS